MPALPGVARGGQGWIGWVVLLLVVIGGFVGGVAYRDQIAALWPPAERLYELANLPINVSEPEGPVFDLRNVDYEHGVEAGQPILRITGEVINLTATVRLVPRLRVAISDEELNELRHWTIDIPPRELQPGEGAAFTTRLIDPPENAKQLSVTVLTEG